MHLPKGRLHLMKTKIVFALFMSLIFLPLTLYAEGDLVVGKRYFGMCSSCHGSKAEGNEDVGAPRLQGQHDWYLIRQLKNFKEGVRGAHDDDTLGHQMRTMAMTLKDDQAIVDVVSYIRTLDK